MTYILVKPSIGRGAAFALAAAALMLTGCSTPNVQSPTASVRQVRLVEQTAEGAKVEVTVVLKNPNGVPLPLSGSHYRIDVAGTPSLSLTDRANKTLPARGAQTLVFPAAIKADKPNLVGAAYSVDGSISYEPPGELRRMFTESGVPLPKVAFGGTGKVE